MIAGRWEHPDRRSRRYYSITAAGPARVPAARRRGRALPRLRDPLGLRSSSSEIYGDGDGEQRGRGRRAAGAASGDLYFDRVCWPALGRPVRRVSSPRSATRRSAASSSGARARPGAARCARSVIEHVPESRHRDQVHRTPSTEGELRHRPSAEDGAARRRSRIELDLRAPRRAASSRRSATSSSSARRCAASLDALARGPAPSWRR